MSLSAADWLLGLVDYSELKVRTLYFSNFACNATITTTADEEYITDDDEGSEGSFHYPTSPSSTRATSIRSHTTDYFSRPSTSQTTTDITPQLSQALEFRVPTHESPQNILTSRAVLIPHSMDAQWEKDETVTSCRGCNRRFTFLFRKVSLFLFRSLKYTHHYVSMCVYFMIITPY